MAAAAILSGVGRVRIVAVLVVAAWIAVACGSSDSATRAVPSTRPHRTTTSVARPPTTTSTAAAPTTTTAPSPDAPLVRPANVEGPIAVQRVVDGDTVVVAPSTTLRLIGMDTPETVDPRKPVQCFGREASARAHALLDGTAVWLEYDASQGRYDKYGRTLAYVWLADGRLFEQVMIADGYAHEYTYDLPYRYQDALIAAERAARNEDRGLWSPATCNGDTTSAATTAVVPSTTGGVPSGGASTATNCDPSYPGVCIPPPPPDLDCADVAYRRFTVVGADPHRFDSDHDGIGCES